MSREIFLSLLLSKIRLYFPLRFEGKKKSLSVQLYYFFCSIVLFSAVFRILPSSFLSNYLTLVALFLTLVLASGEFQGFPSMSKGPKAPFSISFPGARLGFLLAAIHSLLSPLIY